MITSKSVFAARLGVTKGRISQLVAEGLPTRPDGQLDAAVAASWVLANLLGPQADATRDAARQIIGLSPAREAA